MERRKAIKITSGMIGLAIATGGSAAFLGGCKADKAVEGWKPKSMDMDQYNLLGEIVETIIPKTSTPGAKDALVHRYIDNALAGFFTPEQKNMFFEGLTKINQMAVDAGAEGFVAADEKQRHGVMDLLIKEAESHSGEGPPLFYALQNVVKEAFFTSEVGAKEVLSFDPVPGKYQGCIPLTAEHRNWS